MPLGEAPDLDRVLRALSDATRRHIYTVLIRRPGLTTSQLVAQIPGMTRWGVMKHIAVLREAGLIQTFPEGRRRRHYCEPGALGPLRNWVEASSARVDD